MFPQSTPHDRPNIEGLGLLTPERAAAVGLEQARERAARGRALITRMFGNASMADLFKQSYVEQVESMATLLRLIEKEGLYDEVAEFVGKPLLELIEVCQAQYEDMVDNRLGRQRGRGRRAAR